MADINKNIAPIYDASETYDIGTIVNKDNKLYTYLGEDEEMQEVFLSDLIRGKAVSKLNLEPELLWENPSPTSEFAAQTINLDLTNYKAILIVSTHSIGDTNTKTYSYHIKNIVGYCGTTENLQGFSRLITFNNNGVSIGVCYGQYNTPTNNRNMPFKIYGFKDDIIS